MKNSANWAHAFVRQRVSKSGNQDLGNTTGGWRTLVVYLPSPGMRVPHPSSSLIARRVGKHESYRRFCASLVQASRPVPAHPSPEKRRRMGHPRLRRLRFSKVLGCATRPPFTAASLPRATAPQPPSRWPSGPGRLCHRQSAPKASAARVRSAAGSRWLIRPSAARCADPSGAA